MLLKLIGYSDHCIKHFGQCLCQEAYTRQLHSNAPIHEFASPAISQTVDDNYNGFSQGFARQTNHTIEDIRYEGVAVEQPSNTLDPNYLFGTYPDAPLGHRDVSFDTSYPGYQSVDDCFDYSLLAIPNSESQCYLSPTIRETADEVSALNSQSSFCFNYPIPDISAPGPSHNLDTFQPVDETAVYLKSTSSELSSTPELRSSRLSSSSRSNGHTSDDNPVGKMRIDKNPVARRRHVSLAQTFTCAVCSTTFKAERSLERHQQSSCGDKHRKFVCACGKFLKRRDILLRHVRDLNTREKTSHHKIKEPVSASTIP